MSLPMIAAILRQPAMFALSSTPDQTSTWHWMSSTPASPSPRIRIRVRGLPRS
jgi:hypothetical protein